MDKEQIVAKVKKLLSESQKPYLTLLGIVRVLEKEIYGDNSRSLPQEGRTALMLFIRDHFGERFHSSFEETNVWTDSGLRKIEAMKKLIQMKKLTQKK